MKEITARITRQFRNKYPNNFESDDVLNISRNVGFFYEDLCLFIKYNTTITVLRGGGVGEDLTSASQHLSSIFLSLKYNRTIHTFSYDVSREELELLPLLGDIRASIKNNLTIFNECRSSMEKVDKFLSPKGAIDKAKFYNNFKFFQLYLNSSREKLEADGIKIEEINKFIIENFWELAGITKNMTMCESILNIKEIRDNIASHLGEQSLFNIRVKVAKKIPDGQNKLSYFLQQDSVYGLLEAFKLIKDGAWINDNNNGNFMHIAASNKIIDACMMVGENVPQSETINNIAQIIPSLINAGLNINSINWSPLHHAVNHGHINIVKYLIINGADVNAITKNGGYAPLHLAAKCNYSQIIKLLLEAGANPEIKHNEGRTPFETAKRAQNYEAENIFRDAKKCKLNIEENEFPINTDSLQILGENFETNTNPNDLT